MTTTNNTIYTIYSINRQDTDEPIYIGSTRRSLDRRLYEHKVRKNKTMYEPLQELKNNNIGVYIAPLDFASDKQEALQKEREWTLELAETFDLHNINAGDSKGQEHIRRISETQKNNWRNSGLTRYCCCIETGEIFFSTREAARKLQLCRQCIKKVCDRVMSQYYGLHFAYC